MKVNIFTPLESQNPIYLGSPDSLFDDVIAEHNGKTAAEIKEDGYRMQIHKQGDVVKAYTRSMNNIILELYPELHNSLMNLPDCILDSEITGQGKIGHEGFKMIQKRFRHKISDKGKKEYLDSDLPSQFPVALRVFDTLYWEGNVLINKPLTERRKITETIDEKLITPSTHRIITDSKELKSWFESLTGDNYEGLVCKRPDSKYQPGEKNTDWIKLKRTETLDASVVGVYIDKNVFQILCAIYNPLEKRYETIGKVNAKREGMDKDIEELLKIKYTKQKPASLLLNPAITDAQMPHYFVEPKDSIVVEVAAMNLFYSKNWHSAGLKDGKSYSLRIGWLKSIRYDKKPEQSSTVDLLKTIYDKEKGA